MASTVEALVNQALVEIGYPGRIADIYEDSEAARAAIEVYSQTRDELLDAGTWPLARRANIPLVLLKGPPPAGGYLPSQWNATYPPPGWLYEYQYPSDCVTFLAVIGPPAAMFDLDPTPAVWRVDNDNSLVDRSNAATTAKKVILSNIANALATYVGQVLDPSLWEPGFTAALVTRIGEKLSRRLRVGETVTRDTAAAEAATVQRVMPERG